MTRVKRGVAKRKRRKKAIKKAKGYRSHRKTNFRAAQEALLHAGKHQIVGRKQKKRDYARLWNLRINAAVRQHGLSYSQFMGALNKAKVELNRKMLSELAVNKPDVFEKLVKQVSKK